MSLGLNSFGPAATVGDLLGNISARLIQTDHRGVVYVPVPGGVAVVALPGAENPDPPPGPQRASIFSALGFFADLFRGRPGEHRAIAFVVSNEAWHVGESQSDLPDFTIWEQGATPSRPAAYDTVPLAQPYYLVAALYLYRQPSVGADPRIVRDGSVRVRDYLTQTGLLNP